MVDEEHDLPVQSRFDSDAIDADICAVMKSQGTDKSQKNCNDYNIQLIIFLLDNAIKFPYIIQPNLIQKLIMTHD